jgi:glucose-1-phosphate adenylyltransferase
VKSSVTELGLLEALVRRGPAHAPTGSLTKNTLALVLAGGRGTRLAQLTNWRAKPSLPFGGKFRIIDFALSNCVNSGIRRIGICTQYKSQSLIRHVQRGWSFLDGRFDEFVELLPAQQRIETSWYQGTTDAVYQNLDILRRHDPQFVLILAGDHVYKMDYGRMLDDHVRSLSQMTIACIDVPLAEASSFGVIAVDAAHRVTAFQEKPSQPAPHGHLRVRRRLSVRRARARRRRCRVQSRLRQGLDPSPPAAGRANMRS